MEEEVEDLWEAADEERATLIREIRDIQYQLGDRNKLGEDGERMNYIDYAEWRRKARFAIKAKEEQLADVKKWLKDNPQPQIGMAAASDGVEEELLEVYQCATRLLAAVDLRNRALYAASLDVLRERVLIVGQLLQESDEREA